MIGFIALIALIVLGKIPLVSVAASPLLVVATIASGSRGGMLAGLAGVAVLVPLFGRLKRSQMLAIFAILGIFAIVVYHQFSDLVDQTISGRIVDLTFQQRYSSGRGDLLSSAWTMTQEKPFLGWGIGGFADYYGEGFTYPHNLLLQASAEGGVLAVLFLCLSLGIFARAAWKGRTSVLSVAFTASAIVILVSSMFSGDYYDTRFLWIFMLVSLTFSKIEIKSSLGLQGSIDPIAGRPAF